MTDYSIKSPRKLIEVALPLDAINEAAAREKSIRHGHPSTLHLWWARRPLAAARAVIFAQLVNDPGFQQGSGFRYGKNKKEAAEERKRLFKIIEELVKWENTTNEDVLERARAEIRRSWREVCELNKDHPQALELFNPDKLPGFHDPFAGGGTIPLEAQRLGLEAYASDLNPVAVLINKAMIEIPPKFAGRPPVGPIPKNEKAPKFRDGQNWPGASGLAEDVRRYGIWLREEAQKSIGHLYPPFEISAEVAHDRPDLKPLLGQKLTIIAWFWARTVKSPNPAFAHIDVPLVSTFILYGKVGKEAYVHPVIKGDQFFFTVKVGTPPAEAKNGTKLANANFGCLFSGTPIDAKYIRAEACQGRMGTRLMAIVAESERGRVYLPATDQMELIARSAKPAWKPDLKVTTPCHDIDRLPMYGMFTWGDAFTQRQLVALTTFSDLVGTARTRIRQDAIAAGVTDDQKGLEDNGVGALAYAEAVSVYLAFAVSKVANIGSSIASWMNDRGAFRETFARQAIQMTWDFVEANSFADAGGSLDTALEKGAMAIAAFPANNNARAIQADASTQKISQAKFVSTDPPYYDNIGYADLSDFFYVWLRPTLRLVFPQLLATLAVPKAEELVATPYRHGSKEKAESFFLNGMTDAMHSLAEQSHPAAPITIYYAFKQSDTHSASGTTSTGWETFLEAVSRAGLQLVGTWPMRTEGSGRLVAKGTNALASSIVLVCRRRSANSTEISRREFQRELNAVLPEALDEMTKGSGDDRSPVAPVDLSQAIIGPGMAVFSKYSAVLEADGSTMSVRTALQLINRFLVEDDFDNDSQFCLHWFDQNGWNEGQFGQADVLARAKATSVDGLAAAGVVTSGGGKVRLMRWSEYPSDWNPKTDKRCPIWEALHQLIRSLKNDGESQAGHLLAEMSSKAEPIRQLAYRLYTLCERRGWAEDARAYNELITSWSGIEAASVPLGKTPEQLKFDDV